MKVNLENRENLIYKKNILKKQETEPMLESTNIRKTGDEILDIYEELAKEFKDITFRISGSTNINGDMVDLGYKGSYHQKGSNYSNLDQCSIDIDVSILKKMKNNPAYAEEVTNQIKGIKAMHGAYKNMVSEDGSQYMTITLKDSVGKFQIQIQGLEREAVDEDDMKKLYGKDIFSELRINIENSYLSMLEKSYNTREKLFDEIIKKDKYL